MTVAICLLLYGLAVAVFGPRLLARLTRAGAAPRLGVAAWLLAIGSVAASWVAAAAALATDLVRNWGRPTELLDACVTTLHGVASGQAGAFLQAGMFALAGFAAAALVSLAWRWSRAMLRARAHNHRHARMARVIGRRLPGLDAVILDAPERVAYCAPGRPHTVVITTGALDALDDQHLRAVLAHERAHLTGNHHLLVAATRALANALPRISLFTNGAGEIATLLEMCADDTAARSHGPTTVLDALLALSGAAPIPTGTLGAGSVGVLARAERLAETPPPPPPAQGPRLLSGLIALLLTGPAVTTVLAARGMASCLPWTA